MHKYKRIFCVALITASSAVVAKEPVAVDQCWIRLLPTNLPSAGYFIIHNNTNEEIKLSDVSTTHFSESMVHETIEEDGMAHMHTTHDVPIAADSRVEFAPGGLHAMFEQPTQTINVGDTMPLTLHFNNSEKVEVNCKVNAAKARAY